MYVVELPETPTLAVIGSSDRFPVGRVFCIGKNYAAHAREMGVDPDSEPPSIFTKPANSVVDAGDDAQCQIPYPPMTTNLHHEVELVVALGHGGFEIPVERALECVYGYAVGIDFTRRDMQSRAKEKRHPWAMAKGFDFAAPVAPIMPGSEWSGLESAPIWCDVDGERKQQGDLNEMVWPVPNIINVLSRHLRLLPGDLIFTGTPAGVGPITRGQVLTGGIGNLPPLRLRID